MLDQHPPDGRRGAERRDLMLDQRVERRARLEALAERDHGRAGVPGREHARPGVLGPAGRGNVEMRVAGLEAEPVHGREMPDRVARVRVHDELGARRRAGGEIKQHRVVGLGRAVGFEELAAEKHGVTAPARRGDADRDAHDVLAKPGEFLRIGPMRDQKFRLAPLEPVGDVGGPSVGIAGISTRPSFIEASIVAHNSGPRRASSKGDRRAWRRARAGRWRDATIRCADPRRSASRRDRR